MFAGLLSRAELQFASGTPGVKESEPTLDRQGRGHVCVWGAVSFTYTSTQSPGEEAAQGTRAGPNARKMVTLSKAQSTETQKVPIRLQVPHRKGLGQSENAAPLILQVIYFIPTKVSA